MGTDWVQCATLHGAWGTDQVLCARLRRAWAGTGGYRVGTDQVLCATLNRARWVSIPAAQVQACNVSDALSVHDSI